MKRVAKAQRVSFVLAASAATVLAAYAQEGSQGETRVAPKPQTANAPVGVGGPSGVPIAGEILPASAIGPSVVESMDVVLEREANAPAGPVLNPKLRNGAQGTWEVPSRRRNGYPHSGEHYATAKWGDRSMGIAFGAEVDLTGVWVAGHASPQVWAPGIRVVGYRGGVEVSKTGWFDDVDDTPSWFAIGLAGVDRIEVEAKVAYAGAGFYGLDDLTFEESGRVTVLDFDDLEWRAKLTGSGYGGLTWETGTGDFSLPGAVHPPMTPPGHVEAMGEDEGVVGSGAGTDSATLPTLVTDWAGPKQSDPGGGWIPPDTHGFVGPNHFVAVVNQNLSIYNKNTGARVTNTGLQSFFGGGGSKGDPRVIYDHHADRWCIIATDFNTGIRFAYSSTGDPTGSWFKTFITLSLGADLGTWPDYPLLGFDQNGIYIGAFMVGNSMSLFSIDKAPLLSGSPSIGTVAAWRSLPWEGALQPAVTYGTPPGCYVISRQDFNTQRVRIISPPMTSPSMTQLGFVQTKNGNTPPLAPALGSTVDLDTIDTRPMNSVFRNGSLWMTHCVSKAGRAAVNWYQMDPNSLTVQMEGTIKDDVMYFHQPSIAVNANDDVVVGFTASHSGMYAGCWYTGRLSTDTATEMAVPVEYKPGGGAYNQVSGGWNRWGDYSMTSVDPSDGTTFWTIQEHARGNGDWGTRIAELRFDGCPPPTASTPADATRCPGQSVTFSTTAGGAGPFSYQWQKNGSNIGGATSSSYTIITVTAGSAGGYACVVSDGCGATTSAPGTLTVNSSVTATNPASATRCPGQSVTFSTSPGGTGPFTYQWRKDGSNIGGATSSSYTIASVVSGDAGGYGVVVTGTCGSTTTSDALLTVDDPVTATDPSGSTVCPGASVTFNTSAGGTGPFTYQWKKDGSNIGGATSSSHTVNPVAPADAGAYSVVVTGACGSTETNGATLVVDAPVTATTPSDETRCPGASVTFSTTAGGTGPFTYQWKKDGSNIGGATSSSHTIASVGAGDAGTYSVLVSGTCGTTEPSGTLTVDDPVTATDPADATRCPGTGVTFSTTAGGTGPFTYQWKKDGSNIGGATASSHTIASVSAGDAGVYSVAVSGTCGSVTTGDATLTVDTAVSATTPSDETACPGGSATFSTTASGSGPFTYQWKKDGTAIGGATASSYTIASVSAGDAGTYSVLVTGGCGSVEPSATLTVDSPVTASDPTGATVCPGGGATFSTTAGGTGPFTYQWKKDGANIGGATSSSHTIASATAGDAGDYTVEVSGTCGTIESGAATLTVDTPTSATTPSDETACPGGAVTFSTTASGTGPFTYQWKKDGSNIGGANASSYTLASVVAADAGTYSVEVTGACGTVEPSATLTVDSPVTATDPAGATECPGNAVNFATTAGGTGPFTYQWKKDGANIGGATASSHMIAAVSAADAGLYSVVVTGACGSLETGAATLTVNASVTATDPADATECPGNVVNFATTAGGTGPFTYQWKKDGAAIGGATSSSHSIAAVTAGDAGAYSVQVTGACGTVESAAATLTVNEPVTATTPAGATVCPGASVTFTTIPGGTGPFTYQWKKDGSNIGGATSSSHTVNPVASGDAGAYTVAVTGACGTFETPQGVLAVDDPVSATALADQTVCEGSGATFSTTAGGTGPFTYQWRKDGVDIGAATSSSHTLAATTPADAGVYSVLVSGACGSTEPSATLSIDDAVSATDPVDALTCVGGSASFSTTAGGTGPFTYQWKKDGVSIGGATGSSYTVLSAGAADAGDYSVLVTGACGALETQTARLDVGGVFVSYCTAGTSASGCQATLSGTGTPSASLASGFTLSAAGVEGGKDGLFFFGANGRQANPWGSGTSYQCIVPPVLRAGLLPGSGTPGLCDNVIAQDLNALWCASCPKPAKNPGPGATVDAQLWYRDPMNTSNQTTSLSDALEFVVCP